MMITNKIIVIGYKIYFSITGIYWLAIFSLFFSFMEISLAILNKLIKFHIWVSNFNKSKLTKVKPLLVNTASKIDALQNLKQ